VKPAIGGYPHGISSLCSSFVLFGRAKAISSDTGKPLVPNKLISKPGRAGAGLSKIVTNHSLPEALGAQVLHFGDGISA
jgi:hypothetical protein